MLPYTLIRIVKAVMCRDESLDDVHSMKNGRFHEWYEDYKMSDWVEVGLVEAFIKVKILGAPNGRMFQIRQTRLKCFFSTR